MQLEAVVMQIPQSRALCAHQNEGLLYYTFPAFDRLSFIRHGFSTRLGGVSQGIYESMNLSFTRGDDDRSVTKNFQIITAAMGMDYSNTVISAQTHTVNIYNVTAADRGRGITRPRDYTDVDGLITDEPQVLLCTQYADCVPLFFADRRRRVVATSHAGWRGTAAGMGRVTVERMCQDYGCCPEDILVGIGPSIGVCCFEVDSPVYDAFCQTLEFTEDCYRDDGNGKFHIDLWEVNRRILLGAGVKADNITVTDLCTRCHPDVFWSHRHCGADRGSLAAFIGMM